jgi:hypothetical protein
MPTAAERREKIERIRGFPAALEAVVEGLDDARLDTPYRDGGWTVRQVVHHLADSHLNGYARMKWILTEERPSLKSYEQDEWAALPDGRSAPIATSLAILRGLHARWAALLERIPEAGWSRAGAHPEVGAVTLDDLLDLYARHGESHLGQIAKLRVKQGW